MRAIFLLALKDLRRQWGLAVILSALFGVTFAAFLTIITYQQSESQNYANIGDNWLVVGSSSGLGEIYGSRLDITIGDKLRSMGYDDPIPEIREVLGTSSTSMTMVRGVELEHYAEVTPFKLIAGRALRRGDAARSAIVGTTAARNRDLKVDGTVTLRGRKFNVVGIFETGALEDTQVWISLGDAQKLMNYGSDISIYFIPNTGKLQIGDQLSEGISVTQKGENGRLYDHSLQAFFRFLGMVAVLAGLATVITLVNLLWRLAFLHRHEFGIMKALGFRLNAFLLYFGTQVGIILGSGVLVGLVAAVEILFTKLNHLTVFGYGMAFSWNGSTLAIMLCITLGVFGVGVFAPLLSIQKTSIPELLGRN